ncbi:NAD-dependent deacylase [Rhodococcus sp. ABRD24]|uniref:SIR2 family NAD-dependent protein deacylase n=1 Tax=Rhodococcus sp. ABRD24 TaxID=2507582 RepID=UPI001040DE75|nr:NAD-dependent deacylase [Rhodococcus sp. ABRD24]QBJ97857.1 NAD-dependent deacylase [Rhodococcus sp. ABRD24]
MTALELDPAVVDVARAARRVVVFSGAGMSAESGVPTFRDAQTGLWERFDPTELATPEAWDRDSALVWAWYQWRTGLVRRVAPHAGHRAVAEWADRTRMTVVTQNVDDLHERAGSPTHTVAHLHGSLFAPRCRDCGAPFPSDGGVDVEPTGPLSPPECSSCRGQVRPGVVWFGESLPDDAWTRATAAAEDCDLMVVVGTSAMVYPAAGLPLRAARTGAAIVEINPEATGLSEHVHHTWRTTAAVGLPALVAAIGAAQ